MSQIIEVFENFSAKEFIDSVECEVNNFSFNAEKVTKELVLMPAESRSTLQKAIESCVFALAHTDRVDGRNEVSAEVCRRLTPAEDPMSEIGERFLRMHPTLQQAAMSLFCCYMDQAGLPECQKKIDYLRAERGSHWFRFPLI